MSAADPQQGFRFRLVHADGRQEQMLVDAERALIGSASHCELRLPPEVAAHEHVEVVVHDGAVVFTVRPFGRQNPPLLDGVTALEGRWQSGQSLRIADVQIFVEVVSLGMAKAKPPYWALFVAIPAIVLTAVGVALARPADHGLPPIPEAPALIGPKNARCPELAPEQRTVLATEKLRIALAKRERSPFAPQDGIEAVGLFELAAACFRDVGQNDQAKTSDDAADALRMRLDEDYRLRRVRLEHAYRTHQLNAMKRELAVLIPMTSERRGPYTEWLAALDRAVTIELDEHGRLQ
ncbi:MAG TPA: FHA domain-containing protein [Labilithrix sp.]